MFTILKCCSESVKSQRPNLREFPKQSKPVWATQVTVRYQEGISNVPATPDSMIGEVSPYHQARVIFLDVDGTINHPGTSTTIICPLCIQKLKQILDQTKAMIVISSTWRLAAHNKKTLFRYLRRLGIDKGLIIGETRDLSGEDKSRADEIRDWLLRPNVYFDRNFEWDLVSWVSLDDLNLAALEKDTKMKDHHVQIDPLLGLCKAEGIVSRTVGKLEMKNHGLPSENGNLDNNVPKWTPSFLLEPAPQWLEKQTTNYSFQNGLKGKLRVVIHNDNSDDENDTVLSVPGIPQNSNWAIVEETPNNYISGGKHKPMPITKRNIYDVAGVRNKNHRIRTVQINRYSVDGSSPLPFWLRSGHALNEQERILATYDDRSQFFVPESCNLDIPPLRKYIYKTFKARVGFENTAIGLLKPTEFRSGFSETWHSPQTGASSWHKN